MKCTAFAFAVALSLAPAVSFAHGEPPQPAHGGVVQEAHENWVELIVRNDQVTVYVLDEARKPVPASEVSGTASVLIAGKIYKVELTPSQANRLDGKLPVAASGKLSAAVSLKIKGAPATARYSLES